MGMSVNFAHVIQSTSGDRYALVAQSVEHLHGKEGVTGSNPVEGLCERQAPVCFLVLSYEK